MNESSGSHQEPGRPRCETGRYPDLTAGGPGRRTASLNRDKRTEGSAHMTNPSGSSKPRSINRSWWRSRSQHLDGFRCVQDLTAALPLLWTQEIRQTVGDALHLLHLRVLHPTKMEDPSISGRNLTDERAAAAAAAAMFVSYTTEYNCITTQIYTLSKDLWNLWKSILLITRQEEEQSGRTAGLRRLRKNSPRFL